MSETPDRFYDCRENASNVVIELNCTSNPALEQLNRIYHDGHGYISAAVCVLGVLSNILIMIVLTRRSMVSPTNLLLTGIAASDMTTMASYSVYTVYMNIIKREPTPCSDGGHSYGWIVFVLVHNATTITSHVSSTMLTIALATFRYIVVYYPTLGPRWCSMYRAKCTVIGIILSSIIVTLPNNAIYYIKENEPLGEGFYWFYRYEWVVRSPLSDLNMYIYGAGIKILASLLITVLSALLIIKMKKAKDLRVRLKSKEDHSIREHNRTTALLVTVVSSFVLTELPQGILLFAAAANECIYVTVYSPIGDLMDTLVLLNSGINFLLLCGMSAQFRRTFRELFLDPCCRTSRSHLRNGHATSAGNFTNRAETIALTAVEHNNKI